MPAPTSNRSVLAPWKVQTAVGQGQQLFLDLLSRSRAGVGGDLKGEYCVPVYPLDPSSELKSPVSCLYPQPCIRSIPYLNLPLTLTYPLPYLTIKENPL